MCKICNDLGTHGFCTEYSDLLCYINSNYERDEILPALLTIYKYLAPETRVVDVFTSMVDDFTRIVDVFPTAVDDEKECSKCHEIKPATRDIFGWNPRTRDKLTSWCLECKRKADQDRHLRNAYNKTRDEVLMIICDQNDKCACCGDPINIYTKKMHHNHETGEFYDILCHNCNHITGDAHDDYRVILRVAVYQAKKDGVNIEGLRDILKYEF